MGRALPSGLDGLRSKFEATLSIQHGLKNFYSNLSNLSGFKSEGTVKGVRGGVRTGNEGVRTHQHLARIGVKTF